jgi:transposase InsO family protein
MDLYSRRIIGWAMGAHQDETLVEQALAMAVTHRQPPEGLLHHSYAWNLQKTLLDEALTEDHPSSSPARPA